MDLTANYAQKKKISDVEDRWEGNTQIITWIKKMENTQKTIHDDI